MSIDAKAIFTYATQMVIMVCHFLTYIHVFTLCLCLSKLSILELLHNQHYIHLNIKPDNFTLGVGELSNQVFLIDFELT